MPFIGFEPEHSIVSTAVIDYCMIREPEADKPLSGISDILGILRSGNVRCPGGVLAGLLLLGDPEVKMLLPVFAESLTGKDIAAVWLLHER